MLSRFPMLVIAPALILGCGQSEPLPNVTSAAKALAPSQQLCANFIKQAMGSNEVRFKDWEETKAGQVGPLKNRTMFVSWEVRKNDYWEQRTTVIFLPPEQIDPGKQYSAMGDVEGRAGHSQLWITDAGAEK